MQKNWNTLFFRAVYSYTSAVILLSVTFLFIGKDSIRCIFLLELLGLIVSLEGIDYFISKIEFHLRIAYLSAEFLLMYLCFLAFSYFGTWFGFRMEYIILFSGIFVVLFLLLHLYEYVFRRMEANKMNQNLKKRDR